MHIGAPKTATSYCQHMMALNRHFIKSEVPVHVPLHFNHFETGHNYLNLTLRNRPYAGNGAALFRIFSQPQKYTWKQEYEDSFKEPGIYLLSCELFYARPDVVEKMCMKFSELGFKIDICAFLIPILDSIEKGYLQNVKQRQITKTVEAFLEDHHPDTFLKNGLILRKLKSIEFVSSVTLEMLPDLADEALFGAFTNLMGGLEWETRISTNRVNKTNITSEISQTVDNQQQNGGLVVIPKTANVSQKIISPQIKVLVEKRIRQDPKAYFEGFSQETRKSLLKGLNPALAALF